MLTQFASRLNTLSAQAMNFLAATWKLAMGHDVLIAASNDRFCVFALPGHGSALASAYHQVLKRVMNV